MINLLRIIPPSLLVCFALTFFPPAAPKGVVLSRDSTHSSFFTSSTDSIVRDQYRRQLSFFRASSQASVQSVSCFKLSRLLRVASCSLFEFPRFKTLMMKLTTMRIQEKILPMKHLTTSSMIRPNITNHPSTRRLQLKNPRQTIAQTKVSLMMERTRSANHQSLPCSPSPNRSPNLLLLRPKVNTLSGLSTARQTSSWLQIHQNSHLCLQPLLSQLLPLIISVEA